MENELLKANEICKKAIKTSEKALTLATETFDGDKAKEYLNVAMEALELAQWLVAYQSKAFTEKETAFGFVQQ